MTKNQDISLPQPPPVTDSQAVFEKQLSNMLWMEKMLIRTLPKMMELSESADFIEVMRIQHKIAKSHVVKLEEVFKLMRKNGESARSEPMDVLLAEIEQIFTDSVSGSGRDQKFRLCLEAIEQFQVNAYTNLIKTSKNIGLKTASPILTDVLDQEKEVLRSLKA